MSRTRIEADDRALRGSVLWIVRVLYRQMKLRVVSRLGMISPNLETDCPTQRGVDGRNGGTYDKRIAYKTDGHHADISHIPSTTL